MFILKLWIFKIWNNVEKNVVLYEIYNKNLQWPNTFCTSLYMRNGTDVHIYDVTTQYGYGHSWCLPVQQFFSHFSTSLNSQRSLQFHPTVVLLAYVNSWFFFINRQNFFPVSFSNRIGYNSRTTACMFSICAFIVKGHLKS